MEQIRRVINPRKNQIAPAFGRGYLITVVVPCVGQRDGFAEQRQLVGFSALETRDHQGRAAGDQAAQRGMRHQHGFFIAVAEDVHLVHRLTGAAEGFALQG